MAKNKKSKILAMALCASVMTGIYAAPVMAADIADIRVENGSTLNGVTVTPSTSTDYTITSGTLRLKGADIASALNGQNVNLGTGAITANSITSTAGITAAGGQFQVYGKSGGIAATSLSLLDSNDSQNVLITNSGMARFGDNGANVCVEDGVLTVNRSSRQVAALSENGLTLTSGATKATLSAEQIARLNKVVTQNGESIVVTADHFKNTKESFAVDSNGAVKAANGKFNVGADGDVAIRYAEDGAIVANENGFAAQKGSAQTVVTNDGVANIYDDNRVEVNAYGVGIAAGKDNTLTVTDDGIGMQSGTSQVVVNSADGAVFHNGEGSGHTLINGGKISTYSINADVLNGKNVNDLVVGKDIADDLDNIAGIERKTNKTAASTYIEKTVRVNTESGLVVYAKDGTTFAAQIDREGNGTFTGDVKVDGNVLTEGVGRFGALEGANVRMENGVLTINRNATNAVAKLDADGLMLSDATSGEQTLTATKIADIKEITRDPVAETTTIEGDFAVNGKDNTFGSANGSFTVDAEDGTFTAAKGAFKVREGVGETVIAGSIISSKDILGNYGSLNGSQLTLRAINGESTLIDAGRVSIDNGSSSTIISGGTITTGTLEVENIKLGNSMTDKDDNTITIGAAGVIDIEKDGNTVFHADTDNFEAHYDNYDLTLDGTNGFVLSNQTTNQTSSLTLDVSGFAFAGPVHLGNGTQVEFRHNGTDISLSSLVGRVENLEQKTTGISFDETTGSTTIKDMDKGTDGKWTAGDSSVTVGNNGTTFENGEGNGTTNINGSEIVSDAANVESGSGSGSGFGGGTSTTNGDSAVYKGEDGDYTHVSSDGVTIGNETNTNTTNIDKDGMVVDGETGNTHISEGGMTVTDKTDNSTTNIDGNGMVVGGSNGTTHISDSGMTVTGDNGTTNISGGDISVDNSVTVAGGSENKTTINNEGITVGDKGTSIKNDSISVGDGGYIGDGDVRSGEGVSLNDTAERVGHLENRVGELEDRIDKVGAMAAAIANLRTMGYDPAAPTEVAVGIGQYRDETGAALGLFHYPNRDFMLSLSVSTSGDEVMGGIGATWKFGRKSPEKVAEIKKAQAEADVRRAEEAKLAKAEEMKKAAKEAKIKAQQERHAKLAAERAAQAEAAK